MSKPNKKVAVLWTGGKDSWLALQRVQEAGLDIVCLATFVPDENVEFKAHPISKMRAQAAKLGLPLILLPISKPYREGYIAALETLRDRHSVGVVVTGDIDLVDGHPNWIAQCCEFLNLDILHPLWKEPRVKIFQEILDRAISAEISWINHPRIPKEWLGRRFDSNLLEDFKTLAEMWKIDICGENGEYHSMVTVD